MSTIGDSFAIVALLVGFGLTTWAMMLGTAILFAQRAQTARALTERHPWRSFAIGVGLILTVGLFSIVAMQIPNPVAKLIGTIGLFGLISVSMFGMSGLCMIIAGRIRAMEPNTSVYASLTKAATVVVIASIMPVFGWFFVAPLLLIISMGVGAQAMVARESVAEVTFIP
ncbi:MAG: hypothetical protein ABL949_02320 [Fimbriimonadaceae bacterium]